MQNRIENKSYKKSKRLLLGISIAMFVLVTLRLILEPESWKTFGFFFSSAPLVFMFGYWFYLKQQGEQYVEWTEKEIKYKTGKAPASTVALETIDRVEIKLDKITLILNDQSEQIINIESFRDYESRKQIKAFFETKC